MKKILALLIISIIVVAGLVTVRLLFGGNEDGWICENGSWIKHGNPYSPMPVTGCNPNPVEDTEKDLADTSICYSPTGNKMVYEDAVKIAESKCMDGKLEANHFCNNSTGTWWIDFIPIEEKEGCNPACVVFVDNLEAEINWRCTGLRDGGM